MAEQSEHKTLDELRLPDSGLYFSNGQIVRRDKDGTSIATFDCPTGEVIRCRRSIDWGLLSFIAVLISLIYALFALGTPAPWSYVIALPLGFLAFILFASGAIETEIILKSDSGKVAIPVFDSAADAKAFVVSVKERIRIKNSAPSRSE